MVSRRHSSSSSTALVSSGQGKDSDQLDVVFNTDPMFVQAGNGTAVPRGLSGVQHDHSAAPVLNFRSDDAYATMSEISRRASAAKEMKAALKAQIAAKRSLESRTADDDDYEAQLSEHSARPDATVTSSRKSPPIARPSSMPIRSERVPSPPQLHSVASVASDASSVAARRAKAAQELKNALEAQTQAKMMAQEFADNDNIKGDSSQLTDLQGTGSLMDYSVSNLAAWELQDGSSFFNDTKLPSQMHSGITEAWKQSLRARDRRSSTPPFAVDSPQSPEAAPRRYSVHSAADVFARRPPRPSTTGSPSPDLLYLNSSPPRRTKENRPSENRSVTSSPPQGAVGSNPNIGAQTQQPLLRFRSDNHFETSQDLEAKAERQNRQRAQLDAQIAEKQARLEAEQAEVTSRRSPLVNQASGSRTPSALHTAPAASHSRASAADVANYGPRIDSLHTADTSRHSSSHNHTAQISVVGEGSPAPSTVGSAHTHSARENVAPIGDSDLIPGPAAVKADSARSPLEPTRHQMPATPSTDLPAATAPPAATPQAHPAPAQDAVVQLTPEAQRAKDQEEVYRAWQRAHEEAQQEKRRRMRRHHEVAAQEKREREEAERAAEEARVAAEMAAAEKVAAEAAAEDQLQRMQAGSTPAGGTPTGSANTGTPAGTRSTSAVVPTANGEVKVDSKLQPPPVAATDAVKPQRGWFSCCMCAAS